MRTLITGGAGFIGSHLFDNLNGEILIVDNLETGLMSNIPQARFREVDVSHPDFDLYFREFNPDTVIHCAASYKNPDNWYGDISSNTIGTARVVKLCQQRNVEKLIYFQTSLCYGLKPQEHPITLNHPVNPSGSYAISKTAGEQFIKSSGLDYVIFRMANIYGPRNLSGPIPTFYKRLSEGKACYVADTRRDFVL